MEDDIQNYLSTVMFRGTPCIYNLVDCYVKKNSESPFVLISDRIAVRRTDFSNFEQNVKFLGKT